jgi:hypothetical protein
MLDYSTKFTINAILLNGDIADFYALSKFMKDPRKRCLNDEIWQLVEFINVLQEAFNGAKIYYKIGNHEERLENYLKVKAPELLDMNEFKLDEILKLRGITNCETITKQLVYAGRLPIIHGHEYNAGGAGGVNPARGSFMKALSSVMTSHFHRTSSHSERDINDKIMSTFSVACLCDLHPEYALLNKWNNGFARIETEGDEFSVSNFKIHKGKVYSE